MPTSTFTPGDERQEEKLNPGQQAADRRFGDLSNAEKRGTINDGNLGDSQDNESDRASQVQQGESNGSQNTIWKNNTSPLGAKNDANKSWFKKKGPLIGMGGGLGILGIVLTLLGISGTSLLLPNVVHNGVAKNDTRSTILERRLVAALDQKMGNTGVCSTAQTVAACRAGKMPKSMLSAMEKKGITSYDSNGNKLTMEGNGYVDANPSSYSFVEADGSTKTLTSAEFVTHYKENPTFRKKFKGAYNMRYLGYNGKYMLNNFFKKFGTSREGGVASDPDLNESTAGEKLDEMLVTEADSVSEDGAKRTFRERFDALINQSVDRTKKTGGDPILMVGTAACAAINMPRFIAGAYRAIQLSQIILLVNDIVLSPGGMQKAGKADGAKISAIGNMLTEKPRKGDGTLGKSALDSKILQSAMGVNKNKVGSSKYAPGYSLLSNSMVQTSTSLSASTKSTCNKINSPQAAVAVAGIEGALSVSTAGVGAIVIGALKGVAKITIAMGGVEAAVKALDELGVIGKITEVAYDTSKNLIGNYVDGARGEDLGDALGVGMYAYFSQAGSAGGAAPLKTSQVDDFAQTMASVDNEYKEEAIATLSPFDISSQYTFLGSIVSNLSLHSTDGNPIQSGISMLGYVMSSPFSNLSSSASAATSVAESTCSYADDFGVDSDVAVNPSGYPCVGIPNQYINMPRETVMSLVEEDIDPSTGEIKKGSDTSLMMGDCSSADLESISGCVIEGDAGTAGNFEACAAEGEDTAETCTTRRVTIASTDEAKRAAQSLYTFDLQVENILSGNDDESAADIPDPVGDVSSGRPANTKDQGQGWTLNANADYSAAACAPGTIDAGLYTHPGEGFTFRKCTYQGKPVNSLVSTAVVAMVETAKAEGVTLTLGNSFRSFEEQQAVYSKNCSGGVCSPPTAKPGNSQHERGLAIDFTACSSRSTACYQWLSKNAATYGYFNLPSEPWHWSMSGY